MGYAKNGLQSGFTGIGSQFFPITGTGIAISDFNFTADDMYSISIQTLDKGGFTVDNITWNDWTEYPEGSGEYPGFWENNGEGVPTEYIVKPGDGLWLLGGSTSDYVQSAGAVGQEDIVTEWTETGFKLVANSFPVAISINDLVVTATDIYSVSFQTLDAGGFTVDNITWNDWTEYPADSGEYPGFWENNGEGVPSSYTIQPGEALWIFASAGDSVRIPAPEL